MSEMNVRNLTLRERVIDGLKAGPAQGYQLAERLGEKTTATLVALARARQSGHVVRIGHGRYALATKPPKVVANGRTNGTANGHTTPPALDVLSALKAKRDDLTRKLEAVNLAIEALS